MFRPPPPQKKTGKFLRIYIYAVQEDTQSVFKTLCVSCWTAYILQDDTRSLQYQVHRIYSGNLILYGPCIILQYICNPTLAVDVVVKYQ